MWGCCSAPLSPGIPLGEQPRSRQCQSGVGSLLLQLGAATAPARGCQSCCPDLLPKLLGLSCLCTGGAVVAPWDFQP